MNSNNAKLLLTNWKPLPEIFGSFLGTFLIVAAILGLITSFLSYNNIQYFLRVNKINTSYT